MLIAEEVKDAEIGHLNKAPAKVQPTQATPDMFYQKQAEDVVEVLELEEDPNA